MRFYLCHSPFTTNQIKKLTGSFCISRMEFYKYFPRLTTENRKRVIKSARLELKARKKDKTSYTIEWQQDHLAKLLLIHKNAKKCQKEKGLIHELLRSYAAQNRESLESSER